MDHEDNVRFYGKPGALGQQVKAYTEKAVNVWMEAGVIEEKPDTATIIDPSYLQELY